MNRLKKTTAAVATVATAIAMMVTPVLASTPVDENGRATVPVYLTQESSPIDITIGPDIAPIDMTDPDTYPTDPTDNPRMPDGFDPADPDTWPEGFDPTDNTPVYPIDVDGDGIIDLVGPSADAIYMKAAKNENNAAVTDLLVQNRSANAPIYVKGISVGNFQDGYSMEAFSSDWKTMDTNSKKFGLQISSKTGMTAPSAAAHDLSAAYTSTGDRIEANGTGVYTLDGRVSSTSGKVSLKQIAECVVTVAQY